MPSLASSKPAATALSSAEAMSASARLTIFRIVAGEKSSITAPATTTSPLRQGQPLQPHSNEVTYTPRHPGCPAQPSHGALRLESDRPSLDVTAYQLLDQEWNPVRTSDHIGDKWRRWSGAKQRAGQFSHRPLVQRPHR